MKEFKTTEEIKIPKKLIEQVIGQKRAVDIVKKAARQKRNVLLIGIPGTGKSMLARAMSELMPATELEGTLVYKNPDNENNPKIISVRTYPNYKYIKSHPKYMRYYSKPELIAIKTYSQNREEDKIPDLLKTGLERRIANYKLKEDEKKSKGISPKYIIVGVGIVLLVIIFLVDIDSDTKWMVTAVLLGLTILYLLSGATAGIAGKLSPIIKLRPKVIVDNTGKKTAPFIDATGAKAGALLGDVKHDPLQTGGMGTPAHLRVESGAIQKANKGVLFIDEIASLKANWQQELLTAMQEKKYSITGQSDTSSGALVKTEPVNSDFVLVASGNVPDLEKIHPALRSRIRGGGYEIFMENEMIDNEENENKLVQFIAQEVLKDKKIPHFTRDGVEEIIEEARRSSGRKKKFTMNLRGLGGIIRAAGDVAKEENAKYVTKEHVEKGKKIAMTIEAQLGKKMVERKKDYQLIVINGTKVGRVNGLAVLGDGNAGLVLPIVAAVTPAFSRAEGRVVATGKLGTIEKEAVINVSAVIKKYMGKDISKKDIHIQFLQTYEGLEGDSASISIALAVISALENIGVKQNIAMTGSLDVRGDVLPVGGVTGKLSAAVDSGITNAIIPSMNYKDVYLTEERKNKIEIKSVSKFSEVLEYALEDCPEKTKLLNKMNEKIERERKIKKRTIEKKKGKSKGNMNKKKRSSDDRNKNKRSKRKSKKR